jgi:hypothetical protein
VPLDGIGCKAKLMRSTCHSRAIPSISVSNSLACLSSAIYRCRKLTEVDLNWCKQRGRSSTGKAQESALGQTATSLPDWAMSALPSTPEAISAFPILRRRPPRFQEHHPNRPPARVLGRGSDVVVLFGCARSSRPWRLHALPRSGARASSPNNAHQARSTARRDLEFR